MIWLLGRKKHRYSVAVPGQKDRLGGYPLTQFVLVRAEFRNPNHLGN